MIGVEDRDGQGCPVDHDYPPFVRLDFGDGSSALALYQWEAAARDVGATSEGSAFRGVSFRSIVAANDAVDEVLGKAVAAGGRVTTEAAGGRVTTEAAGGRVTTEAVGGRVTTEAVGPRGGIPGFPRPPTATSGRSHRARRTATPRRTP
jgi:predicted enzyme related to lactoylglutathione lyase